jgi:hypothetical protein
VDGEKDLYESFAPPVEPDIKNANSLPGKKGVMVVPGSFVTSDRYLADGKSEMDYTPQMQTLGLWSNDQNHRGISPTPLGGIGVDHRSRQGPETMLAQPNQYEFSCQSMEDVESHPLVSVEFRDKQTGCVTKFSFDVGRGYLPVRGSTNLPGKWQDQRIVTDVRECSNQRWFPDRSLWIITPRKGEFLDVTELKLLEFDADHRPDPNEFAISVPAGTTVNHQTDPSKVHNFFRLKQDEKIHIEDFPKLFTMLERVKITPHMDTAIPRSNPFLLVRWVGGTVGLLVALGGLVYIIRRRLRRQTA